MAATLTRDDSTTGCEYDPLGTWINDGSYTAMLLEYVNTSGSYSGTPFTLDAFRARGQETYTYGGSTYTTYDTSYHWYDYTGSAGAYTSPYATWAWTGNAVYWDLNQTNTDTAYTYPYPSYDCTSTETATTTSASAAGLYSGSSDSNCGTSSWYGYDEVDVWQVTPSVGETLTVSVDTVATATAFDPYMWVNDSDSCTVGGADDSFTCTYQPAAYDCPSLQFTADAETYSIVVGSLGSCNGTTAEYTLLVDAASDPSLAQTQDNLELTPTVQTTTTVTSIDLDGTLVP